MKLRRGGEGDQQLDVNFANNSLDVSPNRLDEIQWNLPIKDTWKSAILSPQRDCPLLGGLKMYHCYHYRSVLPKEASCPLPANHKIILHSEY